MKFYEKPIAELIDFQAADAIMLTGSEGDDLEEWEDE